MRRIDFGERKREMRKRDYLDRHNLRFVLEKDL